MPNETLAVDLSDLDNFMDDATPWRMFETLRRERPVHWNPEPDGGGGFWSLTRYDDVCRAFRDRIISIS